MESAINGVFSAALSKKENTKSEINLIKEIEEVRLKLNTVASHFENQSDPDLIEASIYETKSLSARYRYLLREARRTGLTQSISHCLEHSVHN
jgi:hypothetical protein